MKIKGIICAILTVLLFAGCGPVDLPDTNISNIGTSISDSTNIPAQGSAVPSLPGSENPLTYYVNLPQDAHWSLSTYMCSGVEAFVFSSKKLDSLLNSPVKQDLFANNGGMALHSFDDAQAMEYPLYLYQTYRGMDWEQMAQLKREAEAGNTDAKAALREQEQLYAQDFAALTAEDLPLFYTYLLEIQTCYDALGTAARHHGVQLQFGQDDVAVPLGTLDITNLPFWENLPEAEELPQKGLEAVQVSYWTDTAQLPKVKIDATEQPQVLTEIVYLGGEVTLTDICLTWTENGQAITYQWDGVSSVTVPGNTQVDLSATLHHNGKSVMGYCAGGYLAINREYEGKNQRLWYSLPLTQHWNVYELYAMVVDGIDLAPYYAYAQGYTPAETVTKEPDQVQILDKPLFQQQGCTVTAVDARVDEFAYMLRFALENGTAENVEFIFENLYINGYRYRKYPSWVVPAGERVEMEIVFPWEELQICGITEKSAEAIYLLEADLTVRREDRQYLVERQPLTPLYTQGEIVEPTLVVTENMTLLLDAEKFQLWVVRDRIPQGSIFDQSAGDGEVYYSEVLFVNKSDQNLVFRILGATVNGEPVSTGYVCIASAGRFVMEEYVVFFLDRDQLTVVENITLSIMVEAADCSWTENYAVTYYPNIQIP